MARRKARFSKEIDIHGLSKEEARRLILREIQAAGDEISELVIIHGSNNGTVLLHMVRTQLHSPRIDYITPSPANPGQTTIYLKR